MSDINNLNKKSFKQRFLTAVLWQLSSKIVVQLFSFVITILIARILTPEDYGIFGFAAITINLLQLVGDFGLGGSIIQKPNLTKFDLRVIFGLSIIINILLLLTCIVFAPSIASFYNSDKLTDIIIATSFMFPITCFKILPYNLISKELRFDIRNKIEMISSLAAGLIGLVLAYNDFGVWSLVISAIFGAFLVTLLLNIFYPVKLLPSWDFSKAKDIIHYGRQIMISRLQWYLTTNLDYFIVGKLLGANFLGNYTMAYTMATMPTEKITNTINQVIFPALSEIQQDKKSTMHYFETTTRYISLITFPLCIGLLILAENFTLTILTAKWLPMVFPLQILCIIGLLKSIDTIIPHLLIANGWVKTMIRYNYFPLIAIPLSIIIGSRWGINGVAWAWLAVYPFLFLAIVALGIKVSGSTFRRYFNCISPSLAGSIMMGFCIKIVQHFIHNLVDLMSVSGFFLLVIIGAIFYVLFLFIFYRPLFAQIKDASSYLFCKTT